MEFAAKKDLFIKLNSAVINCSKCRLCKNRINAVVGEGSINAQVVFIGEAPGAKEDELGRPFVGRSGVLLNELLAKIGLSRRDIWVGNIIKCRPPDNRDPMVDDRRI
jgi:DNA polymerase